ncbi:MAG TPA: hypothetical protein VN688_08480 [Gemmataceae bacterium]|nr:hypothetical protein [Gemmataceae bacterium]
MASECLKDERDVYHLWNPSREVEEYWEEQQSAIDRRLILQLKHEPRHHKSIEALRSFSKVLALYPRSPLDPDPFEHFAYCLEDSSFLLDSSFLEGHDQPFTADGLAATFITRQSFPETVRHNDVVKWIDAAIRFFPALCELVTRFTRLFIMQNPDLLANAPERGRLRYMEWVTANSVLETIKQLVNDDHSVPDELPPTDSACALADGDR